MSEDPPIEVRAYQPGDAPRILECWNAVMPAQDQRPPRDLRYWEWQFDRNPHGGKRIMLGVLPDGRVVGQYAGMPYRTLAEGREDANACLVQTVDLLVLPEFRRRGERPGLFVQIGRRYYEDYGQRNGDLLTFGYPVPAWRIGQKYLNYEMVRDTHLVFRECHVPGFAPRQAATDEVEVVEVERFGPAGDELWTRIRSEFGLAIVRDRAYLDWRYAEHPEGCYTMLLCREKRTGRPRGAAVFRIGDFVIRHAGLCVEWLCSRDDLEAELCLIGAMERLTVARGAGVLAALFNQSDPRFVRFQRHGFLVSGSSYFLVIVTHKYTIHWLRDHWFYTLGDTDLV
jgi:hypothetical protein